MFSAVNLFTSLAYDGAQSESKSHLKYEPVLDLYSVALIQIFVKSFYLCENLQIAGSAVLVGFFILVIAGFAVPVGFFILEIAGFAVPDGFFFCESGSWSVYRDATFAIG